MVSKGILKEVFDLSFQEEIKKISNMDLSDTTYNSLSDEEVDILAEKINLLPIDYRSILLLRYCFDHTPAEVDRILQIRDSRGKLRYSHKLLSNIMGFNNSLIDNYSIKKACEIALLQDTKDYDNIQVLENPNYSKEFGQRLKYIGINQNPNNILISTVKRVAIFMIVSVISFSTVLTVNAEIREKVFSWIVEVYEKYSIFTLDSSKENSDVVDLSSFKTNYIPTGFELKYAHKGHSMLIYEYSTKDNQEFTIKFLSSSGKGKSYYDTENAEIEEFIFKGFQAFTWQTDAMTYLIWQEDGTECHISGNLSQEEILKIAENISK